MKNEKIYYSKIRNWKKGETIPTSCGYLDLPDVDFPSREIKENEEGFNIEFYFSGHWIKGMNIDFE